GRLGVLRVTAPVEWVALAPGPRAPPPADAVSGRALGDLPRRLVVAHGVEVVLEPPGAPRGVHARERRALAEVRLDHADAHVQKALELALVPAHRLRVREVERGILRRDVASLVPHGVAALQQLAPDLVFAREVGVLPQADVEAQDRKSTRLNSS